MRPLRLLLATALPILVLAGTPSAAPAGTVEGAVGGTLDTLGGLTCPATSGAIASVTCSLSTLSYRVRTELPRGGRTPLVHEQDALVELPANVDADGDGRRDLIVTVKVTSLHTFVLRIQRTATAAPGLPVKVEALIDAPGEALAGRLVAAGYDASRSSAPADWRATLTLPEQPADGSHLLLDVATTGAPQSLAVLGELSTGHDRRDPAGGSVSFSPVPATLQTDLTLGDKTDDVGVRTSQKTDVGIVAKVVRGDDRQDITGTITALPATPPGTPSLHVHYEHPAEHEQTVVVDSATTLPSVTATYDHEASSVDVERHATLTLTSVPPHIEAHQVNEDAGDVSTGGTGAIDVADVVFAQGMDRAPIDAAVPAGDHAVRVVQGAEDGVAAVALHLHGLRSAAVDGDDTPHLDLTSTKLPLHASFEQPAEHRTVTADVEDLPGHLVLDADQAAGTYHLDGDGTPIDHAHLVATSTGAPLFGRAKVADVTLDDLPAVLDVDVLDGDQGKGAVLSAPVGTLDAAVTDGITPVPDVGHGGDGIALVDGAVGFALHAHASGMQEVRLGDDPLTLDVKAAEPQFFSLDLSHPNVIPGGPALPGVKDGPAISGFLDLPASVHLQVRQTPFGSRVDGDGSTLVDYTGSDPIERLHVDAKGLELGSGSGNVRLDAEGLPTEMHVALSDDQCPEDRHPCGNEIRFDGSQRIRRILAEVLDPPRTGEPAFLDLDPDQDVLHADNGFGQARAATVVQVHGLESFALDHPRQGVQARIDVDTTSPLDIAIHQRTSDTEDGLDITGTMDRPQEDTTLSFSTADGITRVGYTGDDTVDQLQLHVDSAGLGYIDADLRDLPRFLSACLDGAAGHCLTDAERQEDPRQFAELSLKTVASTPWTIHRLDVCTGIEESTACDETGDATLLRLRDITLRNLTLDNSVRLGFGNGPTYVHLDSAGEPFSVGLADLTHPKGLDGSKFFVHLDDATASRRLVRVADVILPGTGSLQCRGFSLATVTAARLDLTDVLCNA